MSRISHYWGSDMSLLLATSLTSVIAAHTAVQTSAVVNRIFAGQSESLQRRRRQEGPERRAAQDIHAELLNKAADSSSGGKVSEQDKATTCNNLADKKGLKGAIVDRM